MDVVQNIILQLWQAFDKYDESYKLSTWIYRISLNVAISNYRKTSTRKKHFSPMENDFVNIKMEEAKSNNEELQFLQQFIDQLDELSKALMILYLDGHSYEEMAGILHISTSNVGSKINRIKLKLKKQFKTL